MPVRNLLHRVRPEGVDTRFRISVNRLIAHDRRIPSVREDIAHPKLDHAMTGRRDYDLLILEGVSLELRGTFL